MLLHLPLHFLHFLLSFVLTDLESCSVLLWASGTRGSSS